MVHHHSLLSAHTLLTPRHSDAKMTISNHTPATLIYFQLPPDGSKPYNSINANPLTGKPDQNWISEPHTVEIENLRGREDSVTLDSAGFQFFRRPQKYTTFKDDEEIEKVYYPESIELAKELTGASRVVVFDHSTLSRLLTSKCHAERFAGTCSHPSPSTRRDRRQSPEEAASSPRPRRPNSCFRDCASSQASPCRRCSRTSQASFPDHQLMATDPLHCVGLASCAL